MAHQGTGVDHVGQALADGALLYAEHIIQAEALRRLGNAGPAAVHDLLHFAVFIYENDRLVGRSAADAGAVLFHAAKIGRDQVLIDQGAHSIVDQDCVGFPAVDPGGFLQSIVNGHLARLSPRNNGSDLLQSVSVFEFLHIGNPFLDADHHDSVDLRMGIEYFYGMYDDRLAVYKEELLGLILGVHPLA